MIRELKFSQDWNDKLTGEYFSTIRVKGTYELGDICKIHLLGRFETHIYDAAIMHIEHNLLAKFPVPYFLLDTGYSLPQSMAIFERMYKHQNIDLKTTEFSYIILKRIR